jgi:hypothetical protein
MAQSEEALSRSETRDLESPRLKDVDGTIHDQGVATRR